MLLALSDEDPCNAYLGMILFEMIHYYIHHIMYMNQVLVQSGESM